LEEVRTSLWLLWKSFFGMAFEHLIFLGIPVAPNFLVSELVDSIIGKGDMSVKNI
jgi:hypothetical protein